MAEISQTTITPCLWFDKQAEEAVAFYTSVFKDSKIHATTRFGKAGFEQHGQPEGLVMTIDFEVNGMRLTALNGGPHFTFNEAVSFIVLCNDQAEIDYYWDALGADGGSHGPCGWLKDKYGLSWQVCPRGMDDMLNNAGGEGAMARMMQMTKIIIADLTSD